MDKNRNSKPLVALLLVAVLGVIGVTFAYFTSTDTFENVFNTDGYSTEVVEEFVSPNDWTPGTTTVKKVTATNTGNIDIAVRVKMDEQWEDATGNELALDLGGELGKAAIINHPTNFSSNWTFDNGYYYYNTKLTKDQSVVFMDSVTFNKFATMSSDKADCSTDAATGKTTCTTTASGYSGATYTLTVTVETVQYDQYKAAWNLADDSNVTIS